MMHKVTMVMAMIVVINPSIFAFDDGTVECHQSLDRRRGERHEESQIDLREAVPESEKRYIRTRI